MLSFFFNVTATTEIYTYRHTLALHDALPIDAGRRPLGVAGHAHQPGLGLHQVVVAGPGLALVVAAVGGDVQADDRRVEAGQAGVVEAELPRLVAAQVVDHRVGRAGQPAEAGLARRGSSVGAPVRLVVHPGVGIVHGLRRRTTR